MPAKRRARQLAILVAAVTLLATAPGPALGAAAQAAQTRPARSGQERGVAVTLLTGDKVLLRQRPGDRESVQIVAAPRRGPRPAFQIVSIRGDVHVIPGDVHHLLGRMLDLDLFNVSALQRMGYGDARASSLPLIVQRRTESRPPALAAAALRPVRELASLRATAMRQPRADAAKPGAALATTTATARRTGGTLAEVRRIWLDRRFRATALDPNLTQIGAPAAWSAGLTGEGVKVAVLDTGIDTTHPDLRGKVVAEANFSEADSATDHYGHGTQRGLDRGRNRRPVRRGPQGRGRRSQPAQRQGARRLRLRHRLGIIAGMEWAARQRAKVVNMSLGGVPPTAPTP